MSPDSIPRYSFDFGAGIASTGVLTRTSSALNGGQPQRIGYWVNDTSLAWGLLTRISPCLADLLDVGEAIYFADRLGLREPPGDQRLPRDRWHRRLDVAIPVRCLSRWARPEVVCLLEELLGFLTDDVWTIRFRRRSIEPRQAEMLNSFLQLRTDQIEVTLLGGGLDSLCGLVKLMVSLNHEMIVPVTVVSNPRVRGMTMAIVQELRKAGVSEAEIMPVHLRTGISGVGRARDDREPSQRARGILFLLAGIVAEVLSGSDRLRVCENGIGAIGLPMTPDHWGSRATKSMHPKTLALMSKQVSIILDRPFAIDNSGLYPTKGNLLRVLNDNRLLPASKVAASCDQAIYMRNGEACGFCTSCVLRRVAVVAAGLSSALDDAAIKYKVDWLDPMWRWDPDKAIPFYAMREQVERVRKATELNTGFAGLARAFPDLFDVVTAEAQRGLEAVEIEKRIVNLYAEHVREVDELVALIDRPGWGRQATVTHLIPRSIASATG